MKNKKRSPIISLTLVATLVLAASFAIEIINQSYETEATAVNAAAVQAARGAPIFGGDPVSTIVAAKFVNADGSSTWALYLKTTKYGSAQWQQVSAPVNVGAGDPDPDLEVDPDMIDDPLLYNENSSGDMMYAMNLTSGVLEILVPGTYTSEGPIISETPAIGESGNYCGPGTGYICVYL